MRMHQTVAIFSLHDKRYDNVKLKGSLYLTGGDNSWFHKGFSFTHGGATISMIRDSNPKHLLSVARPRPYTEECEITHCMRV